MLFYILIRLTGLIDCLIGSLPGWMDRMIYSGGWFFAAFRGLVMNDVYSGGLFAEMIYHKRVLFSISISHSQLPDYMSLPLFLRHALYCLYLVGHVSPTKRRVY